MDLSQILVQISMLSILCLLIASFFHIMAMYFKRSLEKTLGLGSLAAYSV